MPCGIALAGSITVEPRPSLILAATQRRLQLESLGEWKSRFNMNGPDNGVQCMIKQTRMDDEFLKGQPK
jgi:hypothetical protein